MALTTLPRALLFDLDGTLAHTLPQLGRAANEVLRQLGREPLAAERYAAFVGDGVSMLLARALGGSRDSTPEAVGEELMAQARELFNAAYAAGLDRDFRVYDGVEEGLGYFRSRGITLMVLTNKAHRFVEPLLGFMGLRDYFDDVLGSEVIAQRKPAGEPMLHLLARHALEARDCAMVGDSLNDHGCARSCGACSILMTYGYHGDADLSTCGADHLLGSFRELTALIRSLA